MTDQEWIKKSFEIAGLGELFAQHPDNMKRHFILRAESVERLYRATYGKPANVFERCRDTPAEMAAFVQSVAWNMSASMCTVALRLIDHVRISSLKYDYAAENKSVFLITLDDGQHFQSDVVWDVAIFRHILPSKVDERPSLDGYYPIHLPSAEQ